MFVRDIVNYPRGMWVALTVLSLTMPFEEEHAHRSKARVPAAILGTVLFFILFEIIVPEQFQSIIVLLAGFLSMFITDYFIKSIYNSFSSLGAAVLIFPVKGAILLRIISNLIGTVISVVSYYIFNFIFSRVRIKEKTNAVNSYK